jgi:NOL1/NOP2/sun family putative RNA methylase
MNDFHPEFTDHINQVLGSDAHLFWRCFQNDPLQGLRINPSKTSIEEIESTIPGTLSPLSWSENGYLLETSDQPGKHPYHGAGLYYLQEPSAMAPVAVLDPRPGERVLDLCAAPGGKTTQIAASMQNRGVLIANDPNPHRVQALARNLERWGARNTAVLRESPLRLSEYYGDYFDRVLVDAPCSGEGTFRTDPSQIKIWSPSFSERSAAIQDEILWYAGKLVRPGGVLVYSTCTFNTQENEGAIARFLAHNPEFELDPISLVEGFSGGVQLSSYQSVDFSGAVRIWPHRSTGEGHFIARIRKISPVKPQKSGSLHIGKQLSPIETTSYRDFFQNTFSETDSAQLLAPTSSNLARFGNQLYWIPDSMPALDGMAVVHWGWWLGTLRSDRFIPGPALASAIKAEDVQKVIEFSLVDPRLQTYLRGSPITLSQSESFPEGWTLVTVEDHSLGWGKIRQGRLKSYFPRWLRLR